MQISKNLYELAKIFHKTAPLYVVGGYVRDFLLGKISKDVDICASLSCEKVQELLSGSKFKITFINKKMGTTIIEVDDEKYEYTPFRADNYDDTGKHAPVSVEFSVGIKEDATRRDFTINSVYYDIMGGEFIDFFNGISDIQKGVMRAVKEPNLTLKEDSLRIFRLFRQSALLGFDIDKSLVDAVKNNVSLTENLSGERVQGEYKKLVENEFFTYDALFYYIYLLGDSGLVKRYGKPQKKEYEIADGLLCFNPTLAVFYFAVIERYFYDLCPKPSQIKNFNDLKIYGENVRRFTNELVKKDRLPTNVKRDIADLTSYLNILLVLKKERFAIDLASKYYYDIISKTFAKQSRIMVRNTLVIDEVNRLNSLDVPTCVKQLAVNGNDLALLIKKEEISTVLLTLLERIIKGELTNDKQVLIRWVKDEYC